MSLNRDTWNKVMYLSLGDNVRALGVDQLSWPTRSQATQGVFIEGSVPADHFSYRENVSKMYS